MLVGKREREGTFLSNMADIPGATSSSYTTPAVTLANHRTIFRCNAMNAHGSVISASEMLFVTSAANNRPTSPAPSKSGKKAVSR